MEAAAKAAQCHGKARGGFATAPIISNTAPQVRKANPEVSMNFKVYRAVQATAAFLSNPSWQSRRGWFHRTCPPPARRATAAPGTFQPTVSGHTMEAENITTQFQCKTLFNFPLCTTEPAIYKVLV